MFDDFYLKTLPTLYKPIKPIKPIMIPIKAHNLQIIKIERKVSNWFQLPSESIIVFSIELLKKDSNQNSLKMKVKIIIIILVLDCKKLFELIILNKKQWKI